MTSGLFYLFLAMTAGLLLTGCGAVDAAAWSAAVADSIPHSMGGLPPGVPPRPNDAKYAEFISKISEKR